MDSPSDEFQYMSGDTNGTDKNLTSLNPETSQTIHQIKYNPKKPKWWKSVAGNPTKGQKRATQDVLNTNRIENVPYGEFIEWSNIFPTKNDIWLEIGFGTGENLLALAHRKRNEPISIVGAEIHKPGIGIACKRIQQGMKRKKFWTEYETFSMDDALDCDSDDVEWENPYRNLGIYPGDGIKLLPYIPLSSLAVVLITFPDPFPKESQAEWRVVQIRTLLQVHRVLQENGRFFLATDHDGFYEWSHFVMEALNKEKAFFQKLEQYPDRSEWLPVISKYERKGWDEGRQTKLTCWVKKSVTEKEEN
jgi:tRNA G46 methylase TrmB